MKKIFGNKFTVFSLVIALLLAVGLSTYIYAGTLSENDSLITLSYINEVVIPEIKTALTEDFTKLIGSLVSQSVAQQSGTEYAIVELKAGQKLMASESLEFILRPGSSAVCISPHTDVGISDLTFSKELLNGENIAQNSYCVIPRGDGRGILATSDIAYIMVRGGYTIE